MTDITMSPVSKILEQSIALEKGIRDLYFLLADYYHEDKIFWKKLAVEEQKHADVLTGLRPWAAMGGNIEQYLLPDLEELIEKNIAIKKVIQRAKDQRPSREVAFSLAYKIELTASEIHYQNVITKDTDNKLLLSMQELCGADKDHAKRIRKRMDSLGIEIVKS